MPLVPEFLQRTAMFPAVLRAGTVCDILRKSTRKF